MIGIYKIISPTGKIYIGQSINIEKRKKYYNQGNCKGQIRLHNSIVKHGWINHKFEIIEECLETELNDKERYYQDLFECISSKGLNCRLTKSSDRSGKFSEESRIKLSISIKISLKNSNPERYKYHKNRTPEHLKNLSIANSGKKASKESKLKMSLSQKNISPESRKNITESNAQRKIVLDIENGIFYTVKELSEINGVNVKYYRNRFSGQLKNNTNYRYV